MSPMNSAPPSLVFTKEPPGKKAQAAMASADRLASLMMEKTPAHAVDAAVLVLLSCAGEQRKQHNPVYWKVLLIRRNEYAGIHSGQISFPGGKREENDADLWETACRETCEEVGIPADHLRKVGALTSIYVPSSNYLIHPFVAVSAIPAAIRPDPREVVNYKTIPMTVFNPEKATRLDCGCRDGGKRPAPAWRYKGYVIWGATAMILSELYHCIREEALTTWARHGI